MKKCVWILLIMLLFTGCAAEETFETITDVIVEQTPELREVTVELPENAVVSVMESSAGTLYLCGDYEVAVQTFPAGDLNETVQSISGYRMDELTMLKTLPDDGVTRYDFVWSSVDDNGDRIGRAVILNDNGYHYTLTASADAGDAGRLSDTWNALFGSFQLDSY